MIPPIEERSRRSCSECMIDEALCHDFYGHCVSGCKYNITIHEYRKLVDSGVIK